MISAHSVARSQAFKSPATSFSQTGTQTPVLLISATDGLLVLAWIEMASRRLDAEVSCGSLCNARNGRSELLRRSGWRLKCMIHGWRSKRRSLLTISQTKVLCDSGAHHRERRQQHPEPPPLTDRSRQNNRNDKESNAHEDVFERLVERRFSAIPAVTTPSSALFDLLNGRLHHLPRQSLRHQTDICSASATKACTVGIVCGAFRTEHSISRLSRSVFAGVALHKEARPLPPIHSTILIDPRRVYAPACRSVL